MAPLHTKEKVKYEYLIIDLHDDETVRVQDGDDISFYYEVNKIIENNSPKFIPHKEVIQRCEQMQLAGIANWNNWVAVIKVAVPEPEPEPPPPPDYSNQQYVVPIVDPGVFITDNNYVGIVPGLQADSLDITPRDEGYIPF
jgi:hypothetical protein